VGVIHRVVVILGLLSIATSAHAEVYCKAEGVPKGCVWAPHDAGAPGVGVRPSVGAGAAGVGVTPGAGVGAPGVGVNRGGPVNRVGPR
jgi:hypothetical protein